MKMQKITKDFNFEEYFWYSSNDFSITLNVQFYSLLSSSFSKTCESISITETLDEL